MSELLPMLAREIVGSNNRVAEMFEVESRRLEKLRAGQNGAESLIKDASRIAREATRATLNRRADVLGLWQDVREFFDDGANLEQCKQALQNALDAVESWLRLARNARGMWSIAKTSADAHVVLTELDAAEEEIRNVKTAIEKMHGFLVRPRPPVDRTSLEKGRQQCAEGKLKSPEEMRARWSINH